MKAMLFTALLLTTVVSRAQRVQETTNGSWNNPNLSVENWNLRNWIIAGTTETGPTGLCPVFKFTDPALVPIGLPPLPTYRTVFATGKTLNDFTVNQNTGELILTGTDPISATGAPMNMYITVVNAPSGAVGASVQVVVPSPVSVSMIPHQIIYSQTSNQYVVVGTKITGMLTNTNFATIQKTGFMLIVNAAPPFAVVNLIETNTPSVAGGNDSDMLESVTEIPNYGYFAGGSANGFATPGEQNLMVMNANYAGVAGGSCIMDNTNSRSRVASVMHNPSTNQVIVLSNTSNFNNYELVKFNSIAVTPVFPAVRHTISCLPTASVANGFRLQQNTAGTQVIVGGYAWNPAAGPTLTPFQTTTNPGLGTFISAKIFPSANASPLTGYYNESGAPSFINTPDMLSYHANSNRTFLVNPSTNVGFDMLRSLPTGASPCETACQFTAASAQWPVAQNTVAFTNLTPTLPTLGASFASRSLMHTVLCSAAAAAPVENEITADQTMTVSLFPNPAHDQLEIYAEAQLTEATIYDLNGSAVLRSFNTENARGALLIDISALKPGVYVVLLKSKDGLVQRERFVKE